MKKLAKFFFIFFLVFAYQNVYSKPIPPGSGAGDVPANILFLLDTSDSMNSDISAPGTSVGQTNDVVELSDGYLIIAITSGKIKKMSIADGIIDGTFAGGTGLFAGNRNDPNCSNENSEINDIDFLEVSKKVNGISGDVIFAFHESQNKIVMLDSSGVCIDVIFSNQLGDPSKILQIKAMEVRTIGTEDHLFIVGRGTGGDKEYSSLYTKNLTTGIEKKCFSHEYEGSNYISGKMKGHYKTTPYSFEEEIPKRYIGDSRINLEEGLFNTIKNISSNINKK